MLEKLFGKKSTGVMYLICLGLLLLALGGAVIICWQTDDLLSLIGYAVFCAVSLALMTVPVIVQKKFKLFIPPVVEVAVCLYAVIYLAEITVMTRAFNKTDMTISVSPVVGGFCFAMAVFSMAFSLAEFLKVKKGKKFRLELLTVTSFFITVVLLFLLDMLTYVFALTFLRIPPSDVTQYLWRTLYYQSGNLICCIMCYLSVRLQGGDKYRILNFSDAEHVKAMALEQDNKTLYTVVDNIGGDTTDYRNVYKNAKSKFLFIRIFYLVIYAVYLIHTIVTFWHMGGMGYAIVFALLGSFVMMSVTYLYEYYLFKQNRQNQRLRLFKIIKSAVRIYTLTFVLVAMLFAGYNYRFLTALTSVVMSIVNIGMLFYNIFGKPRRYQSDRKPRIKPERDISGET